MTMIDGVETDERAKEPPVAFHDARAKQITAFSQPFFELIERSEQTKDRLFVSRFGRRESGLIDAGVHVFKNENAETVLFRRDVGWKQIDGAVSKRAEYAIKHPTNVIL